jgi:hypothetical protein
MKDQELRKTIQNLSDGEFIDVLDALLGFEFGLTATEWIEHQYRTRKQGVRAIIDEYRQTQLQNSD